MVCTNDARTRCNVARSYSASRGGFPNFMRATPAVSAVWIAASTSGSCCSSQLTNSPAAAFPISGVTGNVPVSAVVVVVPFVTRMRQLYVPGVSAAVVAVLIVKPCAAAFVATAPPVNGPATDAPAIAAVAVQPPFLG